MVEINPNDEIIDMVEIEPKENNENVTTAVQNFNSDLSSEESTSSPSGQIRKLLKEFKEYFNWSDFFFGLIFGLAPTAWDMYTDLELGSHLLESENEHAAGLCYIFKNLPPRHQLGQGAGGGSSDDLATSIWDPAGGDHHGNLLCTGHRSDSWTWHRHLASASCLLLPGGPRHHHHRSCQDCGRCRPHSPDEEDLYEDVGVRVFL